MYLWRSAFFSHSSLRKVSRKTKILNRMWCTLLLFLFTPASICVANRIEHFEIFVLATEKRLWHENNSTKERGAVEKHILSLGFFVAFTKELIQTTVMFEMTVLFIIVPGFRKKRKKVPLLPFYKDLGGSVFVSFLFVFCCWCCCFRGVSTVFVLFLSICFSFFHADFGCLGVKHQVTYLLSFRRFIVSNQAQEFLQCDEFKMVTVEMHVRNVGGVLGEKGGGGGGVGRMK